MDKCTFCENDSEDFLEVDGKELPICKKCLKKANSGSIKGELSGFNKNLKKALNFDPKKK